MTAPMRVAGAGRKDASVEARLLTSRWFCETVSTRLLLRFSMYSLQGFRRNMHRQRKKRIVQMMMRIQMVVSITWAIFPRRRSIRGPGMAIDDPSGKNFLKSPFGMRNELAVNDRTAKSQSAGQNQTQPFLIYTCR